MIDIVTAQRARMVFAEMGNEMTVDEVRCRKSLEEIFDGWRPQIDAIRGEVLKIDPASPTYEEEVFRLIESVHGPLDLEGQAIWLDMLRILL